MQADKPPPNLTFTYDQPAEQPRPYYRSGPDRSTRPTISGAYARLRQRQRARFKPERRPDVCCSPSIAATNFALSQTTAWTNAARSRTIRGSVSCSGLLRDRCSPVAGAPADSNRARCDPPLEPTALHSGLR